MRWHHWLALAVSYAFLTWAVLADDRPLALRLFVVAASMSSTFFTGLGAGVRITREIFRG